MGGYAMPGTVLSLECNSWETITPKKIILVGKIDN